jgi:alpha-aminoadipic semialdehyde synthase
VTNDIQAGASIVSPSTLDAHIIIGIKETPLNEVLTSLVPSPAPSSSKQCPRTHLMFSHTAKGQPYNTPLLAKFVRRSDDIVSEAVEALYGHSSPVPRLIDYELLTNQTDGKRTVAFGWFAGGMFTQQSTSIYSLTNRLVAGVLESLFAMAHSHLEIGIASAFLVSSVILTVTLKLMTP